MKLATRTEHMRPPWVQTRRFDRGAGYFRSTSAIGTCARASRHVSKVPQGDEMEEPPTEGAYLKGPKLRGRRYQKCRNDGKRYCDG